MIKVNKETIAEIVKRYLIRQPPQQTLRDLSFIDSGSKRVSQVHTHIELFPAILRDQVDILNFPAFTAAQPSRHSPGGQHANRGSARGE